jgi:hypothetical protein
MIYYLYLVKYALFSFLSTLGVDDCLLFPYTDYCLQCIDCLDAYDADVPEQGEAEKGEPNE